MKKQLLFISIFGCSLAFSQNQGDVANTLPSGQEVFRFAPGFASQIQAGSGFGIGSNNRWFSHGQVTSGGQTF